MKLGKNNNLIFYFSLSKAKHSAKLYRGGSGPASSYPADVPTPPSTADDARSPSGQLPGVPQTGPGPVVGPDVPDHGVAGHAAAASLAADVGASTAAGPADASYAADALISATIPNRSTHRPSGSAPATPIKTEFPPQALREGPRS